jgi:hypothetical protein
MLSIATHIDEDVKVETDYELLYHTSLSMGILPRTGKCGGSVGPCLSQYKYGH